jgi:hypothetical protein
MPQANGMRPKDLSLLKPTINIKALRNNTFSIQSNVDAKYVYLFNETYDLELNDNYFDLKANQPRIIFVKNKKLTTKEVSKIKIKSLYDVLHQ